MIGGSILRLRAAGTTSGVGLGAGAADATLKCIPFVTGRKRIKNTMIKAAPIHKRSGVFILFISAPVSISSSSSRNAFHSMSSLSRARQTIQAGSSTPMPQFSGLSGHSACPDADRPIHLYGRKTDAMMVIMIKKPTTICTSVFFARMIYSYYRPGLVFPRKSRTRGISCNKHADSEAICPMIFIGVAIKMPFF